MQKRKLSPKERGRFAVVNNKREAGTAKRPSSSARTYIVNKKEIVNLPEIKGITTRLAEL